MTAGGRVNGRRKFAFELRHRTTLRRINLGHRSQQRPGVWMLRRAEHLEHGATLDDAPQVHHCNLVRDVFNDRNVVGDEQVRQAKIALQGLEQVENLGLDRHIQRTRGLVAHQQPRPDRQRAGDGDALPLAS